MSSSRWKVLAVVMALCGLLTASAVAAPNPPKPHFKAKKVHRLTRNAASDPGPRIKNQPLHKAKAAKAKAHRNAPEGWEKAVRRLAEDRAARLGRLGSRLKP